MPVARPSSVHCSSPVGAQAPSPSAEPSAAGRIARLTAERDAARLALAQAEEDRKALIVNLSHELRTPLNAILGYTGLIRSGQLGGIQPRVYQPVVDAIHTAGLHLVDLLDAVLDLAKIGAREMPLQESLLRPADLLDYVARMFTGLAQDHDLVMDNDIRCGAAIFLWADERMVRQMLINLLSNAIKASPPGSRIQLRAGAAVNGSLTLDVRDSGPGMAPADIEMVMQPFRQLGAATASGWRGTGLGLPLTRALIELHGGELAFTTPTGGGTVASLRFPAPRVRRNGQPSAQQEFDFNRTAGPR